MNAASAHQTSDAAHGIAQGAVHMGFTLMRIMIAAYFLASGTALYLDPSVGTPFDGLLGASTAHSVATIYLLSAGTAVMFGLLVRGAALMLAGYVFSVGYTQLGAPSVGGDLSAFWGQMALIGALLMLAVTQPTRRGMYRPWARQVTPRRPAPARNSAPHPHRAASDPRGNPDDCG
jgi:uncharacterized membrane protein YphA (DoxX/SURF4 family)